MYPELYGTLSHLRNVEIQICTPSVHPREKYPIWNNLGDLKTSLQNYEKALLLSPDSMKTYICDKLACACFMQKQYGLALRAIEKTPEYDTTKTTHYQEALCCMVRVSYSFKNRSHFGQALL